MGNELNTCCTNLQKEPEIETDKANLFDFRYSRRESSNNPNPFKPSEKEVRFSSAYAETRPYSQHLKPLNEDPYSTYDQYSERGESVYIMRSRPQRGRQGVASPVKKETKDEPTNSIGYEFETPENQPKKLDTVVEVTEEEKSERQINFDNIMKGIVIST